MQLASVSKLLTCSGLPKSGSNSSTRAGHAAATNNLIAEAPDGRRLRCLLLVMCTHPFAKKALTLHLARSEGHERYFGCNLMHRKVLASSHQHLMTEAPGLAAGACEPFRHFYHELHRKPHDLCAGAESLVL